MSKPTKRFVVRKPTVDIAKNEHPVLAKIYANRGIQFDEAMQRELKHLLQYQSLQQIIPACELLAQHLHQRIVIVGDYDADGATSTAVAVKALTLMGATSVNYFIPNRFNMGYGLSVDVVKATLDYKPDLIITVDNGISSLEGVAFAKQQGINVLVTDHHLPGDELPNADAIVNPNVGTCEFPSKNLAGVGVIFYVMIALRAYLRQKNAFADEPPNLAVLLDIVALGTVADVVPLDSNNRILVHQGLMRIRHGQCCPGIQALIQSAGRELHQITSMDLGFIVGPRLNAAGRLDDMSRGVQCLLADSLESALPLANELNELNQQRRSIEQDMQLEASSLLKKVIDEQKGNIPVGICLFEPHWHEGVIGLLAGRIKEHYHRPTIIFAKSDDGLLKGSGRSIPNLHLRDVLARIDALNPGLIKKFGGHAMAAGLTIDADQLELFKTQWLMCLKEVVTKDMLDPILYIDGELSPEYWTYDFAHQLQYAGPWGQQFPEPIFANEFFIADLRWLKEKHAKMILACPETGATVDAIAFNVDRSAWPKDGQTTKMAYRLAVNEFQGRRNVQLMIEAVGQSS